VEPGSPRSRFDLLLENRGVLGPDVVRILRTLERAGVSVTIEGGWGVDALVRRQTRPHDDLDLAVARADRARAASVLSEAGFAHDADADPGLPARYVLRDASGRQIDFHPLVFDSDGNGWQETRDGAWYLHPHIYMSAVGEIAGERVRCIAPELQLRFHLGYAWTEKDRHDLEILHAEFGVPLPPLG
jgi:lincosamide nucleotidyltransferase A/C/D/E